MSVIDSGDAALRLSRAATGGAETGAHFPPGMRPDDTLRSTIQAALEAKVPGAERVQATVRNSWVTLAGEVPSRTVKRAVAETTRPIPGVAGISDNIRVSAEIVAQAVTDSIERSIVSAAKRMARNITVSVDGDRFVLTGRVHSHADRQEAEAAARLVPGVGHVVNQLRVADRDH